MKKGQVLDLTRRVSKITGVEVPVIVGSQSLFALTEDVPDHVKRSVECDFLLVSAGAAQFRAVTEEIGLASVFQEMNGYYADALGLATVVLPTGWQERLLPLTDVDGELRAYCLEVHDACVSKLMAGREKDFAFILDLLDRHLISVETLAERARLISEMPQKDALLPRLDDLERVARDARVPRDLRPLRQLAERLRLEKIS